MPWGIVADVAPLLRARTKDITARIDVPWVDHIPNDVGRAEAGSRAYADPRRTSDLL